MVDGSHYTKVITLFVIHTSLNIHVVHPKATVQNRTNIMLDGKRDRYMPDVSLVNDNIYLIYNDCSGNGQLLAGQLFFGQPRKTFLYLFTSDFVTILIDKTARRYYENANVPKN
jgi:hypothetical protein